MEQESRPNNCSKNKTYARLQYRKTKVQSRQTTAETKLCKITTEAKSVPYKQQLRRNWCQTTTKRKPLTNPNWDKTNIKQQLQQNQCKTITEIKLVPNCSLEIQNRPKRGYNRGKGLNTPESYTKNNAEPRKNIDKTNIKQQLQQNRCKTTTETKSNAKLQLRNSELPEKEDTTEERILNAAESWHGIENEHWKQGRWMTPQQRTSKHILFRTREGQVGYKKIEFQILVVFQSSEELYKQNNDRISHRG